MQFAVTLISRRGLQHQQGLAQRGVTILTIWLTLNRLLFSLSGSLVVNSVSLVVVSTLRTLDGAHAQRAGTQPVGRSGVCPSAHCADQIDVNSGRCFYLCPILGAGHRQP